MHILQEFGMVVQDTISDIKQIEDHLLFHYISFVNDLIWRDQM